MTPKGWCPGALRPMPAGDGLLLRLRPRASRLSAPQVAGVARLAHEFGNGAIDLTNRASLQLRGVIPERLSLLQGELTGLGLIDADPALEAKRNMLTSPLWQVGDPTLALYDLLEDVLGQSPDLPPKFGFSIDTGAQACLQNASADLRLELAGKTLILRAGDMTHGEAVDEDDLAETLLAVLHWFVRTGCKRMVEAIGAGHQPPLRSDHLPRPQSPLSTALPLLYAPYGASSAEGFAEIAGFALRLTPWRAVLVENSIAAPQHWLTDQNHPSLQVDACPGRPGCATASVQTRSLADSLASRLHPEQRLHVSGCAKGCARAAPADLTLIGRDGRFDLILQGKVSDPPLLRDLSPDDIPTILGGLLAPQL